MNSLHRPVIASLVGLIVIVAIGALSRPGSSKLNAQSLIPGRSPPTQPSPSPAPIASPSDQVPPIQANPQMEVSQSPVLSTPLSSQPQSGWMLTVATCRGQEGNANLRQYGSLAAPIVTVIPYGEQIQLTGQTTYGDGDVWYEAIAPGNIRGWISECFVVP